MSGTDYLTRLKGKRIPSEAGTSIYYFLKAVSRIVSTKAYSGV